MNNFMSAPQLSARRRQSLMNPWNNFSKMKNDMANWFQDNNDFDLADFSPSCEVKENKTNYIVKYDIPGVKKEDVKIELEDNRLTVQGIRKEAQVKEGEKYHLAESFSGSFMRSFKMPSEVNDNKVDAQYLDGVLTIKIPKVKSAKIKNISIN